MKVIVKLLTRPGCCTCDQAKFVLRRLKQQIDFETKVINILKDEQYKIYNDTIPVILVDDKVICSYTVEEHKIR